MCKLYEYGIVFLVVSIILQGSVLSTTSLRGSLWELLTALYAISSKATLTVL
ncbi:hypothetical protein [Metallosphaera tengchongensis]|uniref:hypothetical protein n=1 Tax=Metallosphaera tengchongensis TaxID=1532350 RepID=UPI003CCD3281